MLAHPFSRLLNKAKLLRRSSTPAVPQAVNNPKADTDADPRSSSNSQLPNPPPPPPPPPPQISTDDDHDHKPRAYSTVESLSADHTSSPEEITGPATGSSIDRRFSYFSQVDEGSTAKTPAESVEHDKRAQLSDTISPNPSPVTVAAEQQVPQNQQSSIGKGDRTLDLPVDPLQASSPPETPHLNEQLFPPSASVTPSSPSVVDPFDSIGTPSQPASSRVRDHQGAIFTDPQLTPSLDTVTEGPYRESNPSSYFPPSSSKRPSLVVRRQSLLPPSQQHLIRGLLDPGFLFQNSGPVSGRVPAANVEMVTRKLWVKRPGGSATLVPILEDALVDELRDQVIVKYTNSLGKHFDPPDIVIRIAPRVGAGRPSLTDRMLSPEESLMAVVDSYYPGGQSIEEALLIDIPARRTPKPSPRHSVYFHPQSEPGEHGEYFPLMPANPNVPTPPPHSTNSVPTIATHPTPAMSILTTGVVPPLPSPGSRARNSRRPPLTRHTTTSPTMMGQAQVSKETNVPGSVQSPVAVASIASPPGPPPPPESPQNKQLTPPAPSPRARPPFKLKKASNAQSMSAIFGGLIDGTVPPIHVLIVEDNIINQKLLEAFMKRLSVRWKCAANGEEAVKKWRQGGFHLVLMDIQLPVMNGLDATKEIRRLERLNGIGVFPKTASGRSSAASANATFPPERSPAVQSSLSEGDKLEDLSLFKSPVIIVALTASSLQSDRHEALAAGCNDFLTKPVGFPWLEQKVTEWGCMQALIDFEGWRKWRGFVDQVSPTPSPTLDDPSPMQVGANGAPSKSLIAHPPASPSTHSHPSRSTNGESTRMPSNPPDSTESLLPQDGLLPQQDARDDSPGMDYTPSPHASAA